MAGASSFLAILRISGFFSAVWLAGKLAKLIGVSTIVFEIATGLLLSPSLGALMPPPYGECSYKDMYGTNNRMALYDCSTSAALAAVDMPKSRLQKLMEYRGKNDDRDCSSEEEHYEKLLATAEADRAATHNVDLDNLRDDFASCMVSQCQAHLNSLCGSEPDVFTLVGHTGVSMMIFESGMHFDFDKAKVVGAKACVVAVLGTFLPIVAAVGIVTYGFGYEMRYGLASGVSLAPTSIGIALKLLLEAKRLQDDFGQAIISAAFVDDILSIVIFNILFSSNSGEFTFMGAIFPALVGLVFMVCGAGLGLRFWPWLVEAVLSRVPSKKGLTSITRQDECLFLIMFLTVTCYATFTDYLGTHLWGCFVAGMSFAKIHHAHHVWVRQVKRITVWMLRVFFSCTVAFAIPWEGLLSVEAFWKGSIVGIFACILTKVCCAFFMGDAKFVIGWAMVGRAEFAYYIAGLAKSSSPPLMNDEVFSITIWALLYATIFAPFMFRKVLGNYSRKLAARELENLSKEELERRPSTGSLGRATSKDRVPSLVKIFDGPFRSHSQADTRAATGHTIMDGARWGTKRELTAFRFQIVHAKGSQHCNIDDMAEIWSLLKKVGLYVTMMSQSCDKDTHQSVFQVQAGDGHILGESELRFIQQQIFEELKGLGAHIIFLPPMHALQSVCKLAKIRVIADCGKASMNATYEVLKATCSKSFYVLRGGMSLHGYCVCMEFLVGHEKALEDANDEATTPRSKALTMAEAAKDHAHMGAQNLPDISPEELDELKARLDKVVPGRISTIVEPLTYARNPLGGMIYDFKTLIHEQDFEDPACEIRFKFQRFPHSSLAKLLKTLTTGDVRLVSAVVDERTECQMNVVITKKDLTQEYEEDLLHKLAFVAERGEGLTGVIDLTNLNTPMEKRVINIDAKRLSQTVETVRVQMPVDTGKDVGTASVSTVPEVAERENLSGTGSSSSPSPEEEATEAGTSGSGQGEPSPLVAEEQRELREMTTEDLDPENKGCFNVCRCFVQTTTTFFNTRTLLRQG
eukprot:TRINITY_DN105_c0_g2_i2.p1 TRINITY_DN105_c0_g2~~TRINITY_DN105_c0_g2_i2.p1  ORF type:complete len:1030 (-),score=288.03 TRINITY_DN105_c0_g2_i2:191-3280(-)